MTDDEHIDAMMEAAEIEERKHGGAEMKRGKIYNRYTPEQYAKVLLKRHRLNAGHIARTREASTNDPVTAEFYQRVSLLTEVRGAAFYKNDRTSMEVQR